jgi:hypothetical protein
MKACRKKKKKNRSFFEDNYFWFNVVAVTTNFGKINWTKNGKEKYPRHNFFLQKCFKINININIYKLIK